MITIQCSLIWIEVKYIIGKSNKSNFKIWYGKYSSIWLCVGLSHDAKIRVMINILSIYTRVTFPKNLNCRWIMKSKIHCIAKILCSSNKKCLQIKHKLAIINTHYWQINEPKYVCRYFCFLKVRNAFFNIHSTFGIHFNIFFKESTKRSGQSLYLDLKFYETVSSPKQRRNNKCLEYHQTFFQISATGSK